MKKADVVGKAKKNLLMKKPMQESNVVGDWHEKVVVDAPKKSKSDQKLGKKKLSTKSDQEVVDGFMKELKRYEG